MRSSHGFFALSLSATALYLACATAPSTGTSVDEIAVGNDDATRGGLIGSADFALGTAVPEGLPRFKIKATYPSAPDFKTSAPPDVDIALLKSSDRAVAKTEASRWLEAITKYIYEDMADQSVDPNGNFRLGETPRGIAAKRWHHMPWLHSPSATALKPGRGREAIWGLTRETDLRGPIEWPRAGGIDCIAQDWGIGFFNEPGGYAIARVFPQGPQSMTAVPDAGKFPRGTVSFKILFSSATPEQLPALDGALTIDAMVNAGGRCIAADAVDETRTATKMRHVQMDAMFKYGDRDTEWLFASWVYDKTDTTHWHGMHPAGVQFGVKAEETIVTSPTMEPNGFARDGEVPRLNGPADNPMSSCYSCHARAQWPELRTSRLPFAPKDNADTKFVCLLHDWGGEVACGLNPGCVARNTCIPSGTLPVAQGALGLDMSLQFALALRNRQMVAGRAPVE